MSPDVCDLVVDPPALPEHVPALRDIVGTAESREQRYERVMRFVLTIRAGLGLAPISPPALAALSSRIIEDAEGEVPVACGFSLGKDPRDKLLRILGVCALWGMPAKVVEASEQKAAALAAILASQRVEFTEGVPHAQ